MAVIVPGHISHQCDIHYGDICHPNKCLINDRVPQTNHQ